MADLKGLLNGMADAARGAAVKVALRVAVERCLRGAVEAARKIGWKVERLTEELEAVWRDMPE